MENAEEIFKYMDGREKPNPYVNSLKKQKSLTIRQYESLFKIYKNCLEEDEYFLKEPVEVKAMFQFLDSRGYNSGFFKSLKACEGELSIKQIIKLRQIYDSKLNEKTVEPEPQMTDEEIQEKIAWVKKQVEQFQ